MLRLTVVLLLATTAFAQPGLVASRIVSITDKRGNPVSATASDLRVTVNGAEATEVSLTPLFKQRFRAVVLVDYSGSMRDKEEFLRKYAADTVTVLSSFGIKAAMCAFNEKKLCNIQADEVLGQLKNFHPEGSANLSNAIDSADILFAEQWAHDESAPFRMIVLITDGDIKDAPAALLKLHNIVVFPIGLLGPQGSIATQRKTLLSLAGDTGGRAILMDGPGDLRNQLKRTLDSEYQLLISTPEGIRDPAVHIETIRKDWRVNPY